MISGNVFVFAVAADGGGTADDGNDAEFKVAAMKLKTAVVISPR